jgi:hypothetical protein
MVKKSGHPFFQRRAIRRSIASKPAFVMFMEMDAQVMGLGGVMRFNFLLAAPFQN